MLAGPLEKDFAGKWSEKLGWARARKVPGATVSGQAHIPPLLAPVSAERAEDTW